MTATTNLRTAQVRITFDEATHSRLRAIARREGKSLTALIRELAERRADPVMVKAKAA